MHGDIGCALKNGNLGLNEMIRIGSVHRFGQVGIRSRNGFHMNCGICRITVGHALTLTSNIIRLVKRR